MGTKLKDFILNEITGNLHVANEIQILPLCKCSQIVHVDVGIQVATIGAADINIDDVTPDACLCNGLNVTHKNATQESNVTHQNGTHYYNITHINGTQDDDVTPENSTHENVTQKDYVTPEHAIHQNVTPDNSALLSDTGTQEHGSSSNDDIVNKPLTFKDACKEDLLNEGLMMSLVDKLHANNCLQDFVNLIKLLASGLMSPMIIAFLLCLDVACLLSYITTTQMRFRRATRQFWEVVYRIDHGKMIRLFSASKDQGDMQGKKTTWGHFDQESTKINFAVPSEKSLIRYILDIPGSLHPGFFNEAIKLLDKSKQYILMIDGKKISPALGSDEIGDINL